MFRLALPSRVSSSIRQVSGVGVSVRDDSLFFVELKQERFGSSPTRFGARPLPSGTLENGQVVDTRALEKAIGALRRELRASHVSLALPAQHGSLLRTTVPSTCSSRETENIIAFRLEEQGHIAADQAYIEREELPLLWREGMGEYREVSVYAYPQAVATAYRQAFEAGGMRVRFLEHGARSLARALLDMDDPRTRLIIDIGDHDSRAFLARNGALEHGFALSLAEGRADEAGGGYIKAAQEASEQILQALEEMQVGTTQEEPLSLDDVLLVGATTPSSGLDDALEAQLRIPVRYANVWQHALSFDDAIPELDASSSLRYAAAIGAALR